MGLWSVCLTSGDGSLASLKKTTECPPLSQVSQALTWEKPLSLTALERVSL